MNPFRRAQLEWDIRGSLLIRPFATMIAFIALAEILPALEDDGLVRLPVALASLLDTEPGSAQVVLATLAGSMMTVVSVVYTILVVALTLASMQFSPRILSSFLRHTSTQWTLGLVVATFVYCILILRSIRLDPPFVPPGFAGARSRVRSRVALRIGVVHPPHRKWHTGEPFGGSTCR
jgi:uncharacterized membrane protein